MEVGTMAMCGICFVLGGVAAYLITRSRQTDGKRIGGQRGKRRTRADKPKCGTMDRILVVLAVFLLVFVVVILTLHVTTGSTPDTLITCVFAVCGGECGVMGWIKNTKERNQNRRWELKDRKEQDRSD